MKHTEYYVCFFKLYGHHRWRMIFAESEGAMQKQLEEIGLTRILVRRTAVFDRVTGEWKE